MTYWLFKSEPDVWGWDHQVARGDAGEEWHGVRNYQARNNMRAMVVGDLGFFYHSNIGKAVVGIVEVFGLAGQGHILAPRLELQPAVGHGDRFIVCDIIDLSTKRIEGRHRIALGFGQEHEGESQVRGAFLGDLLALRDVEVR